MNRPEGERRGRARGGFTLIELMVVIALIGILMSMLFPIIASIRRHQKKIDAKHLIQEVGLALANYRMDTNIFPWSATHVHLPIDRNDVALRLLPFNPKVNPGMVRGTGVRDYLPEIKDSWLRDYDHDAGGYAEIVDTWGYSIKFRVNTRALDEAVVWSLGEPDRDARDDASAAALEADRLTLYIGDETADCLEDERAANGFADVDGMDFTDTGSYPSDFYWFGKGDTGNDITNL